MFEGTILAIKRASLAIILIVIAALGTWQDGYMLLLAVLVNIFLAALSMVPIVSTEAQRNTAKFARRAVTTRTSRQLLPYLIVDWAILVASALIGFLGLTILLGVRAYYITNIYNAVLIKEVIERNR